MNKELTSLADQVRRARGKAVIALFTGPPGTGKTIAAEELAKQLRLPLIRVNLAPVTSKYIGETEKNLSRALARAEGRKSVLLFDEADALFGKRSEVKDSHERYANIEVSYLLERVEASASVVILATNRRRNLDQAFLQRIASIVEFPCKGG